MVQDLDIAAPLYASGSGSVCYLLLIAITDQNNVALFYASEFQLKSVNHPVVPETVCSGFCNLYATGFMMC
jgi:hypothetical protein